MVDSSPKTPGPDAIARLRPADPADIPVVEDFLLAMLREMETHGGDPVADAGPARRQLAAHLSSALGDSLHLVLLADGIAPEAQPIGLVEASVIHPHPLLHTGKILHIHAVYVVERYRRRGIGQRLLEAALRWGKEQGCSQARLNVLAGNPARLLYEKWGFDLFEVKMRRLLGRAT